jgi:hypothetical protein
LFFLPGRILTFGMHGRRFLALQGFAGLPGSLDEYADGSFRDTGFPAVNHVDDHVDGLASDEPAILVNSR